MYGGSMRCALLGDQLAELAEENDWAGVVVNGCIRDSAAISEIEVGVKALGVHPLKSVKRGIGERDINIPLADTTLDALKWMNAQRFDADLNFGDSGGVTDAAIDYHTRPVVLLGQFGELIA